MLSYMSGRGMRRATFTTAGIAAALAAILVAAVWVPSGNAAKAPFRVLLVVPKSGPLGFVGGIAENGTKAAANVIKD